MAVVLQAMEVKVTFVCPVQARNLPLQRVAHVLAVTGVRGAIALLIQVPNSQCSKGLVVARLVMALRVTTAYPLDD